MQSTPRKWPAWRWWFRTFVAPALVAGATTLFVATAQSLSVEGGISSLERQALGWMLLRRESRPVDPQIAFVAIDTPLYEETEAREVPPEGKPGKALKAYGPPGCECPLVPRECFTRAVQRLKRWGARSTVLDVVFGRSYSDVDDLEDDRLGDALFEANNVIVSARMTALALDRSRDPTRTSDLVLDPPIKEVAESATVGSPRVDPRDQEYAIELLQTARTSKGDMADYFSMPYLAYCQVTGQPQSDLGRWSDRWIEGTMPRLLGDLFSSQSAPPKRGTPAAVPEEGITLEVQGDVVVDEAFYQKRVLINFAVGSDPKQGRFRPVRLSWLLSCSEEEGRRRFKDKVVLIGDPAADLHRTVVGALPGTEVLAHTLQTLLEDRPLRPLPGQTLLLVMFLSSFLAATFIRQFPAMLAALGVSALGIGLVFTAQELMGRDVWMMIASPLVAVGGTTMVSFWMSSRLGQGVVARLVPARISRQMETMSGFRFEEGTVLFSDIRGYSTFSEYLDPCETMSRLNTYFARVHAVLDRYDGHFIKSPGDAVIAWFAQEKRGAPHEERALRAGLDLVREATEFGKTWPSLDGQKFEVGVGINTGPMAVGFLDAQRHIEPTVIGDTVNLCSRIEAFTKEFKRPLIVSESALADVRDRFRYELLGEVPVRGREQPVSIYAITGLADGVEEHLQKSRWWNWGRRPTPPAVRARLEPERDLSSPPMQMPDEMPERQEQPQAVGTGRN